MHTTGQKLAFQNKDSHYNFYERYKLVFLAAIFFCVVGAYTITNELKDSIFSYVVGKEYIPFVKFLTMAALIPAVFLYSKLVDRLNRFQLISVCSIIFCVGGLIFSYFVGHPTIGISNTDENPYRLFGWLFYFFVEGYPPFVVSVFWAFANSINSPEEAKKSYGLMVSGSKLGGMITAALAWYFLKNQLKAGSVCSDALNHQLLLVGASMLLLLVPVLIFIMQKKVPSLYMHGYEQAYTLEKKQEKNNSYGGIFSGLSMFIRQPYVLGIFGLAFCYDVLIVMLNYMSIGMAKAHAHNMSEALVYLLEIIFWSNCLGFFISLIGTSVLLRLLGTRRCLLIVPFVVAALLVYFIFNINNSWALLVAVAALRGINYSFSLPLRESLYIPTIHDIKFKSKAWIDAFGNKFARSTGSTFNLMIVWLGQSASFMVYSVVFTTVIAIWFVASWLLGKRFDKAIANKEVIGSEDLH